jgi:two-component system chemotaxis sensor kinase CheA
MFDDDLKEKLEMVKCFVTESRELLDDVEPQILALERDAVSFGKIDEEILNAIFRLFHSLKGAASFLDLQTVIRVTHEAETLLDIFRNGQAVLEPGHIDLLIRTSDFIRTILDTVEQQLSDEGFETGAEVIIDDLKQAIHAIEGRQPAFDVSGSEKDADTSPDPAEGAGETDNLNLSVVPEMTGRFVEESIELLDDAERALLVLEKTPDNLESAGQAYRDLHSFKGNAGFLAYAELEEVSHHAETLLDRIREGAIVCDAVAVSFLLIAIDVLRDGVRQIENNSIPELSGKQEICMYLKNMAGDAGEDTSEDEQESESGCLEKTGNLANWQMEEITKEHSIEEDQKQETSAHGETANAGERQEPGAVKEKRSGQQQVIRVDLEKLDKLLDLVGELVISEAMVANNQDLKGLQLDRFEKAVLHLDKITRDIQEVAMSMRMIPLSGTFSKMVRLVRDLSQKVNKKVNLEIIGEETEVDKTIIEQISDPLVHLIRNAVDHGIEEPEERVAAGKPESGQLTIEAKHSAGEVWITIEDDGRGLDRERILQKAIERGLLIDEERDMKDEDVWRLIFEPGFSTADKVSSISGRGVGMDVVKRNIEKLRGRVDIRSVKGAGTVFAVRIPLTLAIIEGMVVKVGPNRYTIPINSIKESLQPTGDQITCLPDNQEVVSIRGELLPVIRLHELYDVASGCRSLDSGILVVVENSEKKGCLFVDEVLGQQQIVIKALSSYLGHVKSVSGCAILGDGDISMILDVDDLINAAEGVNN